MNAPPGEPGWLAALSQPSAYPHPADRLRRLETHISWVFLAGDYAYKLKKPVDFGFLDFSTAARRHRFCEEELRLNRRLAPELYLEVATVRRTAAGVRVVVGERDAAADAGEVLEHAVRMRRFDNRRLLSRLADEGRLTPALVDRLASRIEVFHRGAAVAAAGTRWGRPEVVRRWVDENFAHLRPAADGDAAGRLEDLERWTRETADALTDRFERRRSDGFVRECHGDMHLSNVVEMAGRPLPFDGIEFNEELRWIDVASEVAFPFVDLARRAGDGKAWRFLDRWLGRSGDAEALEVFRYYAVYRALVLAKITALRPVDGEAADRAGREVRALLDRAQALATDRSPAVVVMHGPSGSGKSTLASRLVERLGALSVHSDVERRRRFGIPLDAATPAARRGEVYGEEANRATYDRLEHVVTRVLDLGVPAIVDGAFLRRDERDRFVDLARRRGVPVAILDCRAPADELRRRVAARQAAGGDPSEADVDVLDWQLGWARPVESDEPAIPVETTSAEATAAAVARLEQVLVGAAT